MPVQQLTDAGDLVPSPEPQDALDQYAGLTAEALLEIERETPDTRTKWDVARVRLRRKHDPRPAADIHDVLAEMPQIARINEIAQEALLAPDRKRAALDHADGFRHEEETVAERAKIDADALATAVERLEEFEDLAAQVVNWGRVGKVTTDLRNVADMVNYAYTLPAAEGTVLLEGIAKNHPTEWAAVGVPRTQLKIRKPSPGYKGAEHLLQGVLDRNPVVDVYKLRTDLEEHIAVARQVVGGLLTAYVVADNTKRPTGADHVRSDSE